MNIRFQSTQKLFFLAAMAGLTTMVSCAKNDDNNQGGNGGGNQGPSQARGAFFIDASGTNKEFILRADNLESGEINLSSNVRELEQTGYFWSFDRGTAAGLVYQQQEPGKGLAFREENGALKEIAAFQIDDRFTAYGFFKDYFVTNVSGQTLQEDASRHDGSTFIFRRVSDYGIAKMGNGEFLASMVYSERNPPRPGAGSSIGTIHKYDSIWVAAFDENLTLKRIYKSDKLGYSAGRFRSQTFSQMVKADNGDVYVFSGHFETRSTKPAGALRINKNATDFDSNYFFNIDELSGGYPFRNVYHITGTKFLLEFYNEKNNNTNTSATQYAIVDAGAKTFNWVTGLPAKENITSLPFIKAGAYNGKIYLPIAERGADAAIYTIDPATNVATKGLVIKGATNIRAVGRITE